MVDESRHSRYYECMGKLMKTLSPKRYHLSPPFGFTMIELLVVTAIIIVLTTISMVNFRVTSRKSRDGRREADISQVRSALELYRSTYSHYPIYTASNHVTNFNNLVGSSSFRALLSTQDISDPRNVAPYQYAYVSDGSGFTYTVCYNKEEDGAQYCLVNP